MRGYRVNSKATDRQRMKMKREYSERGWDGEKVEEGLWLSKPQTHMNPHTLQEGSTSWKRETGSRIRNSRATAITGKKTCAHPVMEPEKGLVNDKIPTVR